MAGSVVELNVKTKEQVTGQTQQTPRVSAPIGLTELMHRVHFAYRADGDAFEGGHSSYAVRADAHGIVVTPTRTDLARDPSAQGPSPGMNGTPAAFETVSLGRGATLHDAPLGDPTIAEAGHLLVSRGEGIEEQFENTEDGVEQRFAFASRPAGAGDYVIRVHVSGQTYAGETEHGHHFVDSATGIGLRYGLATWIDARGQKTPVRVDYVESSGDLELTVPEEVLEASAYPAVLDPLISPEMGTDNPILGFVNSDQRYPDVAFDGTNYMVVWADNQNNGRRNVYAARVSPAGAVLSPSPIFIREYNLSATNPAISFNGTDFLVAWADYANSEYRIHSVRLSLTGTIIGSPLVLPSANSAVDSCDIAFDGTNWVVVYKTYSNNDNVYGQRVSSTGALVGSAIPISTGLQNERTPVVAFDGTNYLVAWNDDRNGGSGDIYGARVTKAGTVLDPMGIAISTAAAAQTNPDIAFDGTNYLVVWDDAKWGGGRDIYGAFVSPAGSVMNPTGFEISRSIGDETFPGIAFDGARYVVAWGDTRNGNADVYAARVLPAGVVLDPMGVRVTTNTASQNNLAVACGAGNCLMVFEDQRAPSTPVYSDIWGARIDASGSVLDPDGFPISRSANEQVKPAVVYGNNQYLAVWQDHRPFAHWDIYGTRLDSSGVALDLNGIPISTAMGDQLEPDVTWNGTDWFVAWEDQRSSATGDIYGTRVSSAGTVLDPNGIAISATASTERQAAVSFDGTNHLVVWSDSRTMSGDIYGVRVTTTGTVADANAILIGQTGSADVYPEIAYNGSNYLVVWGRPSNNGVSAARVTPAGTRLDALGGVYMGMGGLPPLDVVYDGLNFFVVTGSGQIYGGRVSNAGTVLDPNGFTIAAASGGFGQYQPGITRDGQGVFVDWRSDNSSTRENMIRGTWISQAGDFSHLGGFVISNIPSLDHSNPVAAADGSGHVLVAYQRRSQTGVAAQHERTYVRLISALTTGSACSDNAACLSGFCVDGVCCNAACGGGNVNDCVGCSVAVGAAIDGTCGALNATPCEDGNGCTVGDTCMTGVCMTGTPNPCLAPDDCHMNGTCNAMTGQCVNAVKPNGSACEDGNLCTQSGSCNNGTCIGSNPVNCPIDTQCNIVGLCDPMTGQCPVTNEPDGMSCDDGNECSQMSVCQNGVCQGSNYKTCPPPGQCQFGGMCDPSFGTCYYNSLPNGTSCNDNSACTQLDSCQNGMCVGMNPVVCPPTTDCATVSPCNAATGTCTVVNEPDGKLCDDGNACTQSGTCSAGQCIGSNPVVCPPPPQCKVAGVCDPGSGQCAYANETNGVACDDGNLCTKLDYCSTGSCIGDMPVMCPAPDACHDAAVCNPATGMCPTPVAKPNGTPCPGGTCMAGICEQGGSSSSSSSSSSTSSNSSSGATSSSSSSSASGGQSSSSGTGGMGGDGGKGASSSSGTGGEGGNASSSGTIPTDPEGCSCRTVNTTPASGPFAAFGAALWLLARRRRDKRGNTRAS